MPHPNPTELVSALLRPKPNTPAPLPAQRRVRAVFNGEYICDTLRAAYVWEHPYYPQFYVPGSELSKHAKILKTMEKIEDRGDQVAQVWEVCAKGDESKTFQAVWFTGKKRWVEEDNGITLDTMVRIHFADMDAWYEEDLPIQIHPKDPTIRLFVLPSTRPLSIRLGDKVLAESSAYYHLIEGALPVRYYMPMTAIDPSILRKSSTVTKCPYKGDAEYFDVVLKESGEEKVIKDAIWWYRYPEQEVLAVAGYACFYNEKVDVWLDGEMLPKAKSKFV